DVRTVRNCTRAVWTGVTRDTRTICDMGGSFFCDAQPLLSPDDMLGCGPRPWDEAHAATRVHHASRRHDGRVAARGARAAGDAGDRVSQRQVARRYNAPRGRVS